MPTYEYRCPEGHEFDRFQRMSDEPVATCPICGQESVRLLSGGAGFLFKGDGFYITDHRSNSYKKEASQESTPEVSSTSAGSSKKSETKKTPDSSSKSAGPSTKGS